VEESESRAHSQRTQRLRRRLRRQGLLLRKVRVPTTTEQPGASYMILDAETKLAVGFDLSLEDAEKWGDEYHEPDGQRSQE
jgi:hypothetical protein